MIRRGRRRETERREDGEGGGEEGEREGEVVSREGRVEVGPRGLRRWGWGGGWGGEAFASPFHCKTEHDILPVTPEV